ncbi:MAG: peptidoglycan DD-metalloendopeptidase family protein, partial [Lachnospiraceae bacterium]|nr:peptidoglycan DD-metalloendopeptidase family protein [Lachnospiraceae bacterium]
KSLSIILAICIVVSYISIPAFATDQEMQRISDANKKIDEIAKKKQQVQNTISKLNNLKNNTQKYIEELDKTLENLTIELNNTLDNIETKQTEIDKNTELLELTKKSEEKQYADMKTRIKFFYEKGDTSVLESILKGNNLSDILTKAEYIQSITDYDREKLDKLVETKNQIIEIEHRLEAEKAELIALKEEETEQKDNIDTLILEKQKELEDTKSKINTSQAELKKLKDDEKKQEEEIAAIERAIAARKEGQRVLRGGLIWPCPSSNRVTSQFGNRKSPTKGASTFHEGIDIGAKTGSQVLAAAAGEVVISKYSYSGGNYIMISHGSGIYTVYMHLSKRNVDVGEEVSQGQKIGEVGSTGYSTGPHLHFGIRKNGKYVNPLTYVG